MRGQVTIFVSISLVLLLVVGILVFVLRPQRTPETGPDEQLTHYIASCLDTILVDELLQLGMTGGAVTIPYNKDHPFVMLERGGEKTLVIIGVERKQLSAEQLQELFQRIAEGNGNLNPESCPEKYNCSTRFKDLPPEEQQSRFDAGDCCRPREYLAFENGPFGTVMLVALCDKDSASSCKSDLAGIHYPDTPPGTRSVDGNGLEEVLAQRVRSRMRLCVRTKEFEAAVGANVKRVTGPEVSVRLTDANVLVHLDYVFTLQQEASTRTTTVDRTYPVRLLPIYEHAFAVAHNLTKDIRYDPALDAAPVGMQVVREDIGVDPASGLPKQVLITITDQQGVRGPYGFRFLVAKKPPMIVPPWHALYTKEECEVLLGEDWVPCAEAVYAMTICKSPPCPSSKGLAVRVNGKEFDCVKSCFDQTTGQVRHKLVSDVTRDINITCIDGKCTVLTCMDPPDCTIMDCDRSMCDYCAAKDTDGSIYRLCKVGPPDLVCNPYASTC